ncbi:uncharacterized protein TM35_000093250 [Trypanosoma theileri]|uniref:Uncharacterized protein n=1 Tax=Trypanosoma theileri TaxID=67003 RepID=A0A1X0P030_9TRYP|nr:uncharacterized protein TM35_000093250 [Trypanosoma theileri]ORC90275.1 hypothetical protein TM35_000093250 [Trypanosoma theileri]
MGAIVGKCRDSDRPRSLSTSITLRAGSVHGVGNNSNHTAMKPSSMVPDYNARGVHLKRKTVPTAATATAAQASPTSPTIPTITRNDEIVESEVRVKKVTAPVSVPLAVPLSSCLVESKYTANSGRTISLTIDPPQEVKKQTKRAQTNEGAPAIPVTALSSDETFDLQSDGSIGFGNDGPSAFGPLQSESGMLTSKNPESSAANGKGTSNPNDNDDGAAAVKGANSLMECSFDSNIPMGDGRSKNRRRSSNSISIGTSTGAVGFKGNISPFLPFLAAHQADERSAKSFVDYITQHALFLRGSRDVTWFNVDFTRAQLRRRTREAMISFHPLEEIAYNDLDVSQTDAAEASTTNIITSAAATPNTESLGVSKSQQPPQQQQHQQRHRQRQRQEEESLSTVRSRVRPIISPGVPHQKQLAKKALEDNVIFIHSRSPKFF